MITSCSRKISEFILFCCFGKMPKGLKHLTFRCSLANFCPSFYHLYGYQFLPTTFREDKLLGYWYESSFRRSNHLKRPVDVQVKLDHISTDWGKHFNKVNECCVTQWDILQTTRESPVMSLKLKNDTTALATSVFILTSNRPSNNNHLQITVHQDAASASPLRMIQCWFDTG